MTLKEALKDLGISQKAFARRIGYDENTVSRWCAGDDEPRIVSLYVGLLHDLQHLVSLKD